MATMVDVARRAGVSIATVSKYLNGGNVLEKNRELIDSAIEELGYQINEFARGLKTNKSKMIGVLIPTFDKIFCTKIAARIEETLTKYDYSMLLCDYQYDRTREIERLKFLISKRVDGIIMMPSWIDIDTLNDLMPEGMPVVLVDRYIEGWKGDCIMVDNINASYGAVESLIVRGHRRIAILNCLSDVSTGRDRHKGYVRVHHDYSMEIDPELIKVGEYSIDAGYELMIELLDMENPPTAVYTTNYEMTIGAIIALNERRVIIPDEMSIIGFDSLYLDRVVKPRLSVVDQPTDLFGVTAAETMLKRVEGDYASYPLMVRLKTELTITESVGYQVPDPVNKM